MIRFMLFLVNNISKTFRLQATLLSIYENEKVIHSDVSIPLIKLADWFQAFFWLEDCAMNSKDNNYYHF